MSTPPPSVMTRIYVLSVVLGSGGVLATLLLPDLASSTRPAAWWVLPIIGIAYAVAERNVDGDGIGFEPRPAVDDRPLHP